VVVNNCESIVVRFDRFVLIVIVLFRTNATSEENSAATHGDAVAYGLGTFTITLLQFIFAALSVDLLNATALKQVGFQGFS
jgi:hypothetical protein